MAMEKSELSDEVTTSAAAVALPADASRIALSSGEKSSMEEMLYALMLPSANDAANAIAEHIGGSVKAFCEMMTLRAAELGAGSTNFTNPHGMPDPNHYTTAYDLALLSRHAMTFPKLCEITRTVLHTMPPTNIFNDNRYLLTTNHMINDKQPMYFAPSVKGIKTGYTQNAGHCLAAAAYRGERGLISVVLGAGISNGSVMSFIDTRTVLNHGFDDFKPVCVVKQGEILSELPIKYAKNADTVLLEAISSVELVLPNGFDVSTLEKKEYILPKIVAPVMKGALLGRMEYWYKGIKLKTVDMIAAKNYERALLAPFLDAVFTVISSVWFYLAVGVTAAGFAVASFLSRRKSRKKRHKNYHI
jgi:D-alanyl-D-alanine carboxypeptidase (penicillin-binding protein 5/6)